MKYGYKIYLDIEEDAWNWWSACNNISHGEDWKQRISKELSSQIIGKTFEEVKEFLIPYLENLYESERDKIEKCRREITKEFDANFYIACRRLEELTGKPLFRKNYKIYLTNFPRGPYWLQTGAIWICIYWGGHIQTFLHEVLHFQFIHYWRNADTEVNKLPMKQFEFLKEALTVILDEDFIDIAGDVDHGYPLHDKLRQALHKQWKSDKNFDNLVHYGLKILDQYL